MWPAVPRVRGAGLRGDSGAAMRGGSPLSPTGRISEAVAPPRGLHGAAFAACDSWSAFGEPVCQPVKRAKGTLGGPGACEAHRAQGSSYPQVAINRPGRSRKCCVSNGRPGEDASASRSERQSQARPSSDSAPGVASSTIKRSHIPRENLLCFAVEYWRLFEKLTSCRNLASSIYNLD